MTVLHSRNADAADAKAAADAKDATDPEQNRGQAATAETGLRDELGRYAELGAFTLTAGTHAWYAAVDTVATPEDARAASTALAELRGSDLQQTWEAVTTLAADAKIEVPGSVAVAALFAETLQRVHQTSATLIAAAYDADLDALVAATADRAWRRENGVKLSFLRARGLRKQAAALVVGGRKARPEELHEALASAKIERRAWAVLAPSGALPVPPVDGPLAERTAAAFEAIGTGLRDLARLLPEHDLDALPFPELIDLVERLAADEGTLYRLPTIRSLRTSLEEAGLADLLAELATARADRRAAEAAYGARQALAGGQRDGLTATEETAVEEAAAEVEVETETDVEPVAESKAETEAESVDVAAADVVTEPKVEVEVEVEADEITAEEPAEARPAVVSSRHRPPLRTTWWTSLRPFRHRPRPSRLSRLRRRPSWSRRPRPRSSSPRSSSPSRWPRSRRLWSRSSSRSPRRWLRSRWSRSRLLRSSRLSRSLSRRRPLSRSPRRWSRSRSPRS